MDTSMKVADSEANLRNLSCPSIKPLNSVYGLDLKPVLDVTKTQNRDNSGLTKKTNFLQLKKKKS